MFVEPSIFANVSFALARIDAMVDPMIATASNDTQCIRAVKDVMCATLLAQCDASSGSNQPTRLCMSACVQMLQPCGGNQTALMQVCDKVYHTTGSMDDPAGSKGCGYPLGASSFVVKPTPAAPPASAASTQASMGGTSAAVVFGSALGGAALTAAIVVLQQNVMWRKRLDQMWQMEDDDDQSSAAAHAAQSPAAHAEEVGDEEVPPPPPMMVEMEELPLGRCI